jgi:ribosomal protein S18 acetylase RimI-like enzyme
VAAAWPAGPAEAETVGRLLAAFRSHLGLSWPSDESFVAGVRRLMADPGGAEYLLGAVEPGAEPCGVAQVRYRYGIWWAAEDCWIEDVFVRDAARGAGVGRALVELAVERARARGCRRVELDVNDANEPALHLYRSLGFDDHDPRYGGGNLLMRLPLAQAGTP